MKKLVCALALLLPMGGLNALELVKEESVLNFVTVKNDAVAELMSFSSLTGSIDDATGKADLNAMAVGEQKNIELRGELKLHGNTAPVVFKVIVTKRSDESFHAATSSPAFISANSFELAPGIGKLRSLAGLQNIDLVVPVTFSVVFQ